MSALCLNVLHDISDAASQYSSSDRDPFTTGKESRRKGFADFFRFSRRRSKSKKKKKPDTHNADSKQDNEDMATGNKAQLRDTASIPPREEEGYPERREKQKSERIVDGNFDISAKSATLPRNIKEDKQHSDSKKKTKLAIYTATGNKQSRERGNTLPPRTDHEAKSSRLTGPLKLLETNIHKMVTNVNRKFTPSRGRGQSSSQVRDGIEAARDKEEQSNRIQSSGNSVVSKKEETKAGNDNPRSAAENVTSEAEQEKYQQIGTEDEAPVTRRISKSSSRGRTEMRDDERLRRGRSAEVRSKKGRRIRRRALSREWVLVKTTTTEDTTFISPRLKKFKHHSPPPPSDEPILTIQTKNEVETDVENQRTGSDSEGLSGRKDLTEGMPEAQSPVQNDMNNNDSTNMLPKDGSEKWAEGIVEWLQNSESNFSHATSELSPNLPASSNEGVVSEVNLPTELERKVLAEDSYVNSPSSIQALLRNQRPEQDKLNLVHTTPQFSPEPTSPITQIHPVSPDSYFPAVDIAKESDPRNLTSDAYADQLTPITTQKLIGKQWSEQNEPSTFEATLQLSHPIPSIIQNQPIVPESYFSTVSMTEDMNVRNPHLETDIDRISPIQALFRKEMPDDLEIHSVHNIFPHDESPTSGSDKSRWIKRKSATQNRKELSVFDSSDAANEPMSETIEDNRWPQFFSGTFSPTECEPFECKIMKRNETQTSIPTKPRWTKRKPATRGRKQSPLRGHDHVKNASLLEGTSDRNQPFFGDPSALGNLSLLEVTNTNKDRLQMPGQSKPRWMKRKSAARAKRTSLLERDKLTSSQMDGNSKKPILFNNTDRFAENYDFSGISHSPCFIEDVGHEPLLDEVDAVFDPVFTNTQEIDEPLFGELSRNHHKLLSLEGIHLRKQFNPETENLPTADKSQIVDDNRNEIEPEFFWKAHFDDKLLAVTSVNDGHATDLLRTVVSHDSKEPSFFWNFPANDESSEFEDRNEASSYGDAEVSDELSVSEVNLDRNEPLFFWSSQVDNDPSKAPLTSSRIEPSSLYEQTEVNRDHPYSDVTNGKNEPSSVYCTAAAADDDDGGEDDPSVQAMQADNSATMVCPPVNDSDKTTEITDDNVQLMRKLNAPFTSYISIEKCKDKMLKASSNQHLSNEQAAEAKLIECDWTAVHSVTPQPDSNYSSTLHIGSQNQPIDRDLCDPDQVNRASPFTNLSGCKDMSVPLAEGFVELEYENHDQHASVQTHKNKSVQDANEDNVFAMRKLSAIVQYREALPSGECPGSVHDIPPDDIQATIDPKEDCNLRDNNSVTNQNDGQLTRDPIIDVISSPGSHLEVTRRSGPRPSENGERAMRGRGSLVDDARTASPKFKCDSGSRLTPSPRNSANEAQIRDWANRRLFSADDDRSSPLTYSSRRLNVDLPYSDSGYSETEAETLSPCSFRSSVSRTETVTEEEGRWDTLTDDDNKFTFQKADDMRSLWYNLGRDVCEKEFFDCLSIDNGSQMSTKELETSWPLETIESNNIDLSDEPMFLMYKSFAEKSSVAEFDSQNTVTEKPTVEALKNEEYPPAPLRPGKTESEIYNEEKKNAFDSSVSGSVSTVEALNDNEFPHASQAPGQKEPMSYSDAKNAFDSPDSGSDSMAETLKNNEIPTVSQRSGKKEPMSYSDAKNAFDSQLSGSEPTVEALENDVILTVSQRSGKPEPMSYSDAKNAFDSPVFGSDSTVEALENNEIPTVSQRSGETEPMSYSDAKNAFDTQLSGSEPTVEALENNEIPTLSQRSGETEPMSYSDAKNAFDSPVFGSDSTVETLKNNEISTVSQRSGKKEPTSYSDGKNSLDSPMSESDSAPVNNELSQLKKEIELSCKARERLSPEMQMVLDQEEETIDESVAPSFRKQELADSTALPNNVGQTRSESRALNNEKLLTGETRLHGHSSFPDEELFFQHKTLPDEVLFIPQQYNSAETGTTSPSKIPVDEALVSFERDDELSVERVVTVGKALESFKSLAKIDILRDCAAKGAIKTQTDCPIVYSSFTNNGEPVKCYIVPENEIAGARDEKPIKRTDHLSPELSISVVKENLGTDHELFTWYEYAELLSIFRQFPKENYDDCTMSPDDPSADVDLSLLPSTWIWNGSRFINYYASKGDKENTVHFPDPRPCRSISCPMQQDTFTLVHDIRPRHQSLSTLERLRLGCSAERQALMQIKALRSRIQENRSPKDEEDLVRVKALLNKIQTSHLLGEEAVAQVKALLGKVKESISREKEERSALSSEIQCRKSSEGKDLYRDEMLKVKSQPSSSPVEKESIQCCALPSQLHCRNSSEEEEDLVTVDMPEGKTQQSSSPVEEELIQCMALPRQLLYSNSSEEEEELVTVDMPEDEIQPSSSPVEEGLIQCMALPRELLYRNSSEEEEELVTVDMPEDEIQPSSSPLEEGLIQCMALPRELLYRNSSEGKEQIQHEMPEDEIQQSSFPVEEEYIECNALPMEFKCMNSSEDEELVQDEVMSGKVRPISTSEEEVLIVDKALPSDGLLEEYDSVIEGSTNLSQTSADQKFSAAEHDDGDVLKNNIAESKCSETPVPSINISEPKSQESRPGEADISSESQLRQRSHPAPDDEVNATFDDVIPKQPKDLRSKRTVVCLLASTAGLLSALLIFYLGLRMKYIDI